MKRAFYLAADCQHLVFVGYLPEALHGSLLFAYRLNGEVHDRELPAQSLRLGENRLEDVRVAATMALCALS